MSAPGLFEPTPERPSRKRSLVEDLDPEYHEPELKEPALKRRREETPVLDWLSDLPAPPLKVLTQICRSRSVPAKFNDDQVRPTAENLRGCPKSPLAIDEMGDRWACDRGETQNSNLKTQISRLKSQDSKLKTQISNPKTQDSKLSDITKELFFAHLSNSFIYLASTHSFNGNKRQTFFLSFN